MNLCCLMPTYGRTRELVENAIACFEAQTYDDRSLLIVDDEGYFREQHGERWSLFSTPNRFPDLGTKYNEMVRVAKDLAGQRAAVTGDPRRIDGFVVWDDDDVYLPDWLANVAEALKVSRWSHPRFVWSTYTGEPRLEHAAGRFHGSLAVDAGSADWVPTRRATFDQEMIAKLASKHGEPGRPDGDGRSPGYVFRWNDTGSTHCQAFMRSGTDETWYATYADEVARRRARRNEQPPKQLEPRFDESTRALLETLTNPTQGTNE